MNSELFDNWEKRVNRIDNLTNTDGAFMLSSLDYLQVVESCPPEQVRHYLIDFMTKVVFLWEECVILTNGQITTPTSYQNGMYRDFIHPDPEVNTTFLIGNRQSARITPNARLSVCSWEGLDYLHTHKVVVRT